MKNILKKVLPKSAFNFLKKINYFLHLDEYHLLQKSKVTYAQDLLYTFHNADFMKDKLFLDSYALGKATGSNLLHEDIHWRIHVLCWAAYHAKHLEGDFVDCGVNTGVFSRAIINYIDFNKTGKKYYLLDTFEGLDKQFSSVDELKRNSLMGYKHEGSVYEQVKATFKDFNVEIIKGAVPATLPLVKSDKICFLSIDMNCVKPEVDALEFFWDKMVSGGVILLDDYGYANSTNDQKMAHDAFAERKGVKILTMPTCQGLLIKP